MPLTPQELTFLDAYVYEATHGPPFGGPATRDLAQRGVWYSDLSWLLTAYQRELCAAGRIPSGIRNPTPPPSPWENLEQVKVRNQALRRELESPEPDPQRSGEDTGCGKDLSSKPVQAEVRVNHGE